jgi:hypothetical protein
VLIDFPWILAFWVPLLPPAPHLLDLLLLGAHDVLCELLYLWNLALFGGYLGHVYGRLVMRDHGVDERLVEGVLLGEGLRVIIMPIPRICSMPP